MDVQGIALVLSEYARNTRYFSDYAAKIGPQSSDHSFSQEGCARAQDPNNLRYHHLDHFKWFQLNQSINSHISIIIIIDIICINLLLTPINVKNNIFVVACDRVCHVTTQHNFRFFHPLSQTSC